MDNRALRSCMLVLTPYLIGVGKLRLADEILEALQEQLGEDLVNTLAAISFAAEFSGVAGAERYNPLTVRWCGALGRAAPYVAEGLAINGQYDLGCALLDAVNPHVPRWVVAARRVDIELRRRLDAIR